MMKNILLAISIFALAHSGLQAQALIPKIKKWKIESVGLRLAGFSNDYGDNLDYQGLQRMLKDPSNFEVDMEGFDKSEAFFTNISGGQIGFQVQLDNKITERFTRSIVAFVDLQSYGELLLDYEKQSEDDMGEYMDYSYSYVGWCLVRDRIDFGVEYNFTINQGNWGFSMGPSLTYGKSFNDRLIMMGESDEALDGDDVTRSYQAIYTHLLSKVDVDILRRINFYMQLKKGIGYEIGHKSLNYMTRNATTFGFGLNYILKR